MSLLPAAGATQSSEAAAPSDAGAVVSESWTPGQLDIDWAAFARENRTEYESSQWAALADGQDAAAAAARSALVDNYTEATGADGGLDEAGATFNDLETQRSSALAQQYYDECDDGTNLPDAGLQASRESLYRGGGDTTGGVSYNPGPAAPPPAVDLRSIFIAQTTDDNGRFDQTGFLVYACQEWATAALGSGGVTFGLYTTFEDGETEYPTVLGDSESGPDFVVSLFPEPSVPNRPLQVLAARTPSPDPATWTLTYAGPAQRIDGFEIDGVVPTSAIGDFTADSGFAWTVEVVDAQENNPGRDWFPERNWQQRAGSGEDAQQGTHIPQFPVPDSCGLQTEGGQIAYRLTPQQVTPNDDGYRFQWYHDQMNSPEAWSTIRDSSSGGRDRPVTVAVVDTGIDATRFDFRDGGSRIVGGLDAVYGLELEGGDAGGAIGPFIGADSVPYETFGASPPARNSDRDPHGTGVASLIGARGNNTFGIAGVDWGVNLMPIRVNDVNGCIGNTVVAEGIKWAVDHGADVVHVSLGAPGTEVVTTEGGEADTPECSDGIDNDRDGTADFQPANGAEPDFGCEDAEDGSEGLSALDGGDGGLDTTPACSDGRDNNGNDEIDLDDPSCTSPEDNFEGNDGESQNFDPLREVIDYALEKGVPVVAAAGNFGSEDDPIVYPAAYPGVITVGATDRDADRAFYSSTGRWLDTIAPGGNNSRTLAGDIAVLWELDRVRSVAGTSFAAPLVTGSISLYMGLNPQISRDFVRAPDNAPYPPDVNLPEPDGSYQRTVDDVRLAVQNASIDLAPAGHDAASGHGRFDLNRMLDVEPRGGPLGDPARGLLPRTNVDSVVQAAEGLAVSRPEIFPAAVLARADVAVDALAGAPLTANAPLLVARGDNVAPSTMEVLAEKVEPGGTVYVLGGEAALGPQIDTQLSDAGYDVVRLAGDSRYQTALAIAEEVRRLTPETDTVAIARADGGDNPTAQWADALSGGAWAAATDTPIVITGTDALHPEVAAALEAWGTTNTVVFGGEAAVSDAVAAQLPSATRIAGPDRASTAVAVASELWGGEQDGYLVANGYFARGWVHGLAAAGVAADTNSPLLYTGFDDVPPATAQLLAESCVASDGVRIAGGATLVSGTAEAALMEATTC
ncbi:S8 family serine peptidase [Euzebya tangerina]|uniref:S8 family serine peptidase n=1 Tax=Euzebya tangerina TaxID=591198 RepID=UPI0013C369C9|nr:S8 family serine peptidase [Euzebya tangerina]